MPLCTTSHLGCLASPWACSFAVLGLNPEAAELHPRLLFWRPSSVCLAQADLSPGPPASASQVGGITDMCLKAQLFVLLLKKFLSWGHLPRVLALYSRNKQSLPWRSLALWMTKDQPRKGPSSTPEFPTHAVDVLQLVPGSLHRVSPQIVTGPT